MSLVSFSLRLNKLEKKLSESTTEVSESSIVDNSEELTKLNGKIAELESTMQSSSLECKKLTNLTKNDVDGLSQKITKFEEYIKKLEKKVDTLKKASQQDNSSQV